MTTVTRPTTRRTSPTGPAPAVRRPAAAVDVRGLESDLRRRVNGEVRFDPGSRAAYSTDASNYRLPPIGVVVPRTPEAVAEAVAVCRDHGAPVLSRGGGTSLAGQCCNTAVVMDMSKYLHHVISVDPDRRTARVQPGTVLDVLRDQAERHHLTFGPDPSTHNRCTLGGMIGNNSCGIHSVMAGRTADNVHSLDVLTYDGLRLRVGATPEDELSRIIAEGGRRGEIYGALRDLRDRYADLIRARFPRIPRRVSGYNLDELLPEQGFQVARALVGTEGTCVTVLEAELRLVESPPARSLLVLGYPDVYRSGDDIPMILETGPVGCEGMDRNLYEKMQEKNFHARDLDLLPAGDGWLMVEFGGRDKRESDANARRLMDRLKSMDSPPAMKLFDDEEEESRVWEIRESGLGATARPPEGSDTWPGWEDAAVPPERVGGYLRDFRDLLRRYGYDAALYGHFGDGCIHCRIDFDLRTREGIARYRSFVSEAADLVTRYGGSLSGEHGDGQSRAELLPRMYGEELVRAFGEFKAIWDPGGKMNPGKVVDPYPIVSNLRLGSDYQPWQPPTHFTYPEDGGSFARATTRCVGVGKCRRQGGGTMCPSYMVTREEEHSTRGRARILFEMLQGEVIGEGWKSEAVKRSLDLCLACKGCKADCPVNVDMATYKAEFLSHYYHHRLRPRAAYGMGLIHIWGRWGARVPRVANFFSQTPGLRDVVKWLGGIAPERSLPPLAPESFRTWFRRRTRPRTDGEPVLLWPDTFNNAFHPDVLRAGVESLERLGCQVRIPEPVLCCGRALYDYGMLDTARGLLEDVLRELREPIRAGIPLVGMEPSCVAVFRDELGALFPHDQDAYRLRSQSYTLGEFLEKRPGGFTPPSLSGPALYHGHCHHKSIMGTGPERRILDRMGLQVDAPETGCCGMAGSFGFEKEKYGISMKVGERVLLPAVRDAGPGTLIIADGFSCRTQVEQATQQRPLHLAQVLCRAWEARETHERNGGKP